MYIFIKNFLNSLSAWWLLIHSTKIVHWKKNTNWLSDDSLKKQDIEY